VNPYSGCTGAVRPPDKGDLIDMKKTRSIYCTESEYWRLKDALALIRVYDNLGPAAFSGKAFIEESFWKIVKGKEMVL
jgi:hypothetical protein